MVNPLPIICVILATMVVLGLLLWAAFRLSRRSRVVLVLMALGAVAVLLAIWDGQW